MPVERIDDLHIVPAGDAMFLIEWPSRIDPDVNERAIALASRLRQAALPGVLDIVPAYRSVGVFFDPLRSNVEELLSRLRHTAGLDRSAAAPAEHQASDRIEGGEVSDDRPIHRVPVCYGGDYGPDLDALAASAELHPVDAIAAHASRVYRVYMLGFMPGFAYMAQVDARIAWPRRATPRVKVPAGSVGIAGQQTGIYPLDSPGGWNIIGRTPLRPFDLRRGPTVDAFAFQPGDRVQFHAIDEAEYARLAAAARASSR
jgi:inhibitor of KinA